MRVDGADHGLFGVKFLTRLGYHTGGPAAFDQNLPYRGAGLHRAAVILDAVDERLGQHAAAALCCADAVLLQEAEEHEDADAGALLLRAVEVLTDHAQEKEPHA